MSKIRFGVKNLKYSKITYSGSTEVYGGYVDIPGAKSISLSPAGESMTEYADDSIWYSSDVNNGYTGNAVVEELPISFLKDIFGMIEDSNGALFESDKDTRSEFALAGEFTYDGDSSVNGKRFCLFRNVATRPDVTATGKQRSITVDTETLNFTTLPRKSDGMVKATAVSTDSAYTTWFNAVVVKTITT